MSSTKFIIILLEIFERHWLLIDFLIVVLIEKIISFVDLPLEHNDV